MKNDSLFPDLPRPGVLCTIVGITGSHPQRLGAKMYVTEALFHGTLGGGRFELEVLGRARELLRASQAAPELREYVLCRQLGQCCGGRAKVFFDVAQRPRTVHLFGAGHVGRAAAEVLAGTPLAVVAVDPRAEWARGLPEGVETVRGEPVAYAESRSWGPDDAVCVITHSHDLDYALVRFFLRQPVGFLGLIGSEHKASVFQARLKAEGPDYEALWEEKMHCPIGKPLPSKNPKVIAVAVAAQLLEEWGLKPESVPAEPA